MLNSTEKLDILALTIIWAFGMVCSVSVWLGWIGEEWWISLRWRERNGEYGLNEGTRNGLYGKDMGYGL